jgi:hypothetical protein
MNKDRPSPKTTPNNEALFEDPGSGAPVGGRMNKKEKINSPQILPALRGSCPRASRGSLLN